jgi:hypothetical protein
MARTKGAKNHLNDAARADGLQARESRRNERRQEKRHLGASISQELLAKRPLNGTPFLPRSWRLANEIDS